MSLSTGFVYNSMTIKLVLLSWKFDCDWMRVLFSKQCAIYC